MGSSWWFLLPVVAFLPWLLWWGINLITLSNKYAMPVLCGIRTLFFYSGNIQFFIYTIIAEILFVSCYGLCCGQDKVSKLSIYKYFSSYLITFLLSLPLLLPMYQQVKLSTISSGRKLSVEEMSLGANNLIMWFWGLVWPFSSLPIKNFLLIRT
jgi:hypothetical protein